MTKTDKIRINFVRRAIPTRGPFSSDDYNSAMQEASVDLNSIATRWNAEAYTLFNSLPRGTDEDRWAGATEVPDPLADGLDGTTIFMDLDATEGTLWSDTYDRPVTLQEYGTYLDDRITSIYNELTEAINDNASGWTSDQWSRLGEYINDGVSTSTPGSLYDVAHSAYDDIALLISDVFNDPADVGDLNTSGYTLEEMVGKLLELHGTAWNTDPTSASHGAISTAEEGYIRTFIGKGASGSETPTYGSTRYITNGSSLETAIGALDSQLYTTTTNLGSHTSNLSNPHQVSLEQARTQSATLSGGFTVTTGDINMNNAGRITNLLDPSAAQDAATKLWVETQLLNVGTATRYEQAFSGHTDIETPLIVTHSLGVVFPLVQVVDTSGAGGEYSGLLIDETYTYEREIGLSASGAFVNVEYTDGNSFKVYTDITDGVIIYVC